MAKTILEMASEILSAQAKSTAMGSDELLAQLSKIHSTLKALETGETAPAAEKAKPAMTIKQAFGKKTIICLICGKSMKTLTRHLNTEHGLKPKEYRKQFGISSKQALSAKALTEQRKQTAIDKGLAGNLAKARATRAANVAAKVAKTAAKPAAPVKAKAVTTAPVKAKAAAKATPVKPSAKAPAKVKAPVKAKTVKVAPEKAE